MECTLSTKVNALNRISKKKLTDLLDKIPGQKDLIIDSNLIKPLERIIGVSKLRTHGIDKIYKLDKNTIQSSNSQVVYFIPSDLITVKYICDQINADLCQNATKNSYYVILVPRKLMSIMQLFEEEGIYGSVTVYQYQWELIELDSSILSLEFPNFFRTTFVNSDQSYLPCIAKSIWSLQMLFGKPLMMFLQGKYSQQLSEQIDVFCNQLGTPDKVDPDIGTFVVVDRDIDYASVLLTPGTYTSLLEEVFGIKSGEVKINTDDKKNDKLQSQLLNSSDEIYSQIKNRHFSDVFSYLSTKAKELQGEYKRNQNMALHEMKRFISQDLQNVTAIKKSLAFHIGACEAIISKLGKRFEGLQNIEQNMLEGRSRRESYTYIEENIAMNFCDMPAVLRLMCLLSLTQDGLTYDEINNFKVQFFHAYGYKYLSSFHNLEKLGLFVEQPGLIGSDVTGGLLANKVVQAVSLPTRRSAFYSTGQKLKLFPAFKQDIDLKSPTDMSYVFNGAYVPAICQIINMLIRREITVDELTKLIPNSSAKVNSHFDTLPKTFLVYVVGGITYSEVAAFQLLERLTGTQIIVAGTSVISGNSMMMTCI